MVGCFYSVLAFILNYSCYISLCYTIYCSTLVYFSFVNWRWMMFHPKHVLIKYVLLLLLLTSIFLQLSINPWLIINLQFYTSGQFLNLMIACNLLKIDRLYRTRPTYTPKTTWIVHLANLEWFHQHHELFLFEKASQPQHHSMDWHIHQ